MESWKDLEILLKDYREALIPQKTQRSGRILMLLNTKPTPEKLIKEFEERPNATLPVKNGGKISLWAGGVIIDGEHYDHKTVIQRIKELVQEK